MATLTQLFTLRNLADSWQQIQEKFRYAPFRDIIDYRDYHFFIYQKVKRIRHEVLSIRYRSTYSVRARSQKSKGINRVLTYFHPNDLIIYNLLCQHVYRTSKKHYFRNAYFSRSLSAKHADIVTAEGDFFDEPYGGTFKAWKRYSGHRAKLGRKRRLRWAVITDIANFFETIHHETIRDSVSPNVKNAEITNILLLILGDQILRPRYSAHLRLGIPQDSFDCSRVLANLVLLKIDKLLDTASRGEWVRWMDDISFAVPQQQDAHRVLRDLTEKLREDGLTLNSGKTMILESRDLKKHLLIVENALLDKLKDNIAIGRIASSSRTLKSLWFRLKKDKSPAYWEKVVGRVYALAGELKDPFLISESLKLLITYPKLAKHIFTYFESIDYTHRMLELIEQYFRSGFDLYEEVRVRALESLIALRLPPKDRTRALSLAWRCFLNKTYQEQDYSRAVALLVIGTYGGSATYRKLQLIFQGDDPKNFSQVIRRYLVAILLSGEPSFHSAALARAPHETGDLVKDLMLFTMHAKTRSIWDAKTLAAFKLNKTGYSGDRYIPIRKVILLGILTHHPDAAMRHALLDQARRELASIGVLAPRPNCRLDELLFKFFASRR